MALSADRGGWSSQSWVSTPSRRQGGPDKPRPSLRPRRCRPPPRACSAGERARESEADGIGTRSGLSRQEPARPASQPRRPGEGVAGGSIPGGFAGHLDPRRRFRPRSVRIGGFFLDGSGRGRRQLQRPRPGCARIAMARASAPRRRGSPASQVSRSWVSSGVSGSPSRRAAQVAAVSSMSALVSRWLFVVTRYVFPPTQRCPGPEDSAIPDRSHQDTKRAADVFFDRTL